MHSVLYIYHKFQWQPLQTGKTYAVNVKRWRECRKNILSEKKSIFLNNFFYNHIMLTAMITFPQGSIYFFLDGEIVCMILRAHFTIFYRYCYSYDVKVDTIFFVFPGNA